MAGFTKAEDEISAVSVDDQENVSFFRKIGTTPEATGEFYSFWKDDGTPGAGANPAAGSASLGAGGEAYDLNDGGLWKWADVEGGGKYRHLTEFAMTATTTTSIILFDRLVGVGGISVASTGNKDCNTVALPRYTDGIDVECWLEFSTASTATVGSITLNSYTNENGTNGRSGAAVTMPAAATNIGTAIRLHTQAGDRGIKSVQTINVGTATTTGVVNLVLAKRICEIDIATFTARDLDLPLMEGHFPRLYDGFTPWIVMGAVSTGAVTVLGIAKGAYK